jgi:hypothetical protein
MWARRPSPGSGDVKGAEEMTSRTVRRTSTGRKSRVGDGDIACVVRVAS